MHRASLSPARRALAWIPAGLALLTLGLAGCSVSRVPVGSVDGGADTAPDGGGGDGGPVLCGPRTCAAGQVCCNASCGTCTGPEMGCTERACSPCEAQDAAEVGTCDRALARPWAWNGGRCVSIGCDCEGEDCDDLSATEDECLARFVDCLGPCAPQDIDGFGACEAELGWRFNGADCVGVSGCRCEGTDCDEMFSSREACALARGQCHPLGNYCETSNECALGDTCDACARASCPACDDCIPGCVPTACETEAEADCLVVPPTCPRGTARVIRDGCWECVTC